MSSINRLTEKQGSAYKLSPDEVKAFNNWEYRRAEGGRTPFPSKLSKEELEQNVQAIKDFSDQNRELEKRFFEIQNWLNHVENKSSSSGLLIVVLIIVVIFLLFILK